MYRRQSEPSNELRMIRSAKGFLHIARQLGKGSFASVYEAWDSAGGQYAVKVRHPFLYASIGVLFLRPCAPNRPLLRLIPTSTPSPTPFATPASQRVAT